MPDNHEPTMPADVSGHGGAAELDVRGIAPDIVVRPFRRRDVPGFVELRRHLWAGDVTTAASFAWSLDHEPAADQARRWVATQGGRVVGAAEARRAQWTSTGVALCHVGVDAALRGRGIGRRLFDQAERHLARIGPAQTRCRVEGGHEPSTRFARDRGFCHARSHRTWSLDPRFVSTPEFPVRLAHLEAAGLHLAPLRGLMHRPQDLYRLSLTLLADVPADLPAVWSYEDWRAAALDTPLFSADASFCIVAGDEPVALTWILLDSMSGRAEHGITGTLPAYRHRGLARLVKLATIRWLADHGVTDLSTENDTENRDMLALNENLGYEPRAGFEVWMREG